MTQTLLAIGAHCDDCIIGIPGILLKAARRGYRIVIVALIGDYGNWPPAARMQERDEELRVGTIALCQEYGAELRYLDFKSQHVAVNPDAAKAVARVAADLDPDLAFLPWREDYNDDHVAASRLGEAAIR
jgi:LmbE family N-acetylglucosaminyl deacetylase